MKTIILAAGFATRLYPITEKKSKPLLKISGKPIINYIIEKVREISEEEIIIVTNSLFYSDFLSWKKEYSYSNVTLIDDGVSIPSMRLGAIGDLLFAVDKLQLNEDLLVICGDNLFTYSLADSFDLFRKERKNLSLFFDLRNFEEAKRFGVAQIDSSNIVCDFEEKPNNPKTTLCSTSTYFFLKESIPLMREFCEIENMDQPGLFLKFLYKRVPLYAHVVKEKWIDVGTIDSLNKANKESWN